ncbi:unnamed protein product [Protopolystoma xenopodis]|uniref:Uncharacterized protein n=1 Tax=Protopolystoma xenopodis TaxID=117903 RepID=A0A3S5BGC4_9PLAT|nr:unnamed protein product [Protopolystoma xenopodis]
MVTHNLRSRLPEAFGPRSLNGAILSKLQTYTLQSSFVFPRIAKIGSHDGCLPAPPSSSTNATDTAAFEAMVENGRGPICPGQLLCRLLLLRHGLMHPSLVSIRKSERLSFEAYAKLRQHFLARMAQVF